MPIAEPQATERQAKTPTLRIGERLQRERERRGYDLHQIAEYLCIRRGLLVALENSRYEEFPADAYVIGFLRSYATLLEIDGQDAIDHYRREMAGRRRKPDLVLPTPVSEGRAPTAVIMGTAALASLLIYVMWYVFSTSDRATISKPPALPTVIETTSQPGATIPAATEMLSSSTPSGIAISAPAPTQKAIEPAAPATAPENTPASVSAVPQSVSAAPVSTATSAGHIVIKADQSSWILISSADGQTVFDRVMKPGETYRVPETPGLTLTTGNGAGIAVYLDGRELPRLSTTTSHIVRNVPLETKSLRALPQPTQ